MNETMLKLRIWVHAETTLLKINARRTGQQVTLLGIALGLSVLTVGMINLGIYELMAETYGRARGAFYLAGANAAFAAILVLFAVLKKPGPEQEMVSEIRDMALDELQADADAVKEEYERIAAHVRQIESMVSTLTASGSTLSKVTALSPVVELAVEALKSRHDK